MIARVTDSDVQLVRSTAEMFKSLGSLPSLLFAERTVDISYLKSVSLESEKSYFYWSKNHCSNVDPELYDTEARTNRASCLEDNRLKEKETAKK